MISHIINGHYMFGNTFIQPEMPMYERFAHHNMAAVGRLIPPYPDMATKPIYCPNGKEWCFLSYEDSANKIDTPYDELICDKNNCECDDCPFAPGGIIRDPLVFNVINIESTVIKTLKITIYGTSADKDKTVEMKIGNRYAITYITEHGLITSVGRLEVISESVPDACTRYINAVNMAAVSTAYIGMDCSTEGNSDKRKIYISTIRYIQELENDEQEQTIVTKSLKDQLQELLTSIQNGELVFCDKDCCGGANSDNQNPTKEEILISNIADLIKQYTNDQDTASDKDNTDSIEE